MFRVTWPQYYQFFKVKIYSGTDNFKTTLRQFEVHIYILLEERMHNELFESDEKREEVALKNRFFTYARFSVKKA